MRSTQTFTESPEDWCIDCRQCGKHPSVAKTCTSIKIWSFSALFKLPLHRDVVVEGKQHPQLSRRKLVSPGVEEDTMRTHFLCESQNQSQTKLSAQHHWCSRIQQHKSLLHLLQRKQDHHLEHIFAVLHSRVHKFHPRSANYRGRVKFREGIKYFQSSYFQNCAHKEGILRPFWLSCQYL